MAWFRAGGGGIPSALKTDMNAVLNKKFGTSQDYPPTDWAPSVNLLGPLPEKTASGSVASITDGADGVPLKNWGVTVDATLSGVSAVECTKSGKNLLLRGATSDTINGVTFTVNSDGSVTVNGTASANTAFPICNVYLKAGSYILSGAPPTGMSTTYEFQVIASNGTTYREYGSGRTFTLAQGTDGLNEVRILIRKNYVANNLVFYPQLELGSTASAYEPINGTTHTASLGRTIYGGNVDVVNGTGTDDGIYFGDDYSQYNVTLQGINQYGIANFQIASTDRKTSGYNYNNLGLPWQTTTIANTKTEGILYNNSSNIFVRINSTTASTKEQFETWANANLKMLFEKATPETFTFPPISPTPETMLGVNNFWADEGDSDVTYRADIDLLLGGN